MCRYGYTANCLARATLATIVLLLAGCREPEVVATKRLAERGVVPGAAAVAAAVADNDAETLRLLIEAGSFLDMRDATGRTPLIAALVTGRTALAALLLDGGASIQAEEKPGVTALSYAITGGELEFAKRLLELGAEQAVLAPDGAGILPWCLTHGRADAAKLLLEHGADPHQRDAAGTPILHLALAAKQAQIAELLLDLGADAARTAADGGSSVLAAMRAGLPEFLPRLLARGADVRAVDVTGTSALEIAYAAGDLEQVRLLLNAGAGETKNAADRYGLLWRAWQQRRYPFCRLLLAHDADPAARGPEGKTLVEAAFECSEYGYAHLFLQFGAPAGDALHAAVVRGDREAVDILIGHWVPVNPSRAPWLATPLTTAVATGREEIALRLIEAGAQFDLLGADGQPLLHVALANGNRDLLRRLLELEADPNKQFRHPVSSQFLSRVRSKSMRWFLQNDRRITPLMMAADSGDPELARLLLAAGAKKNIWTARHRLWPLNFASRKDDIPMMRVMLGRDEPEQRRIVISLNEQRARVVDTLGNVLLETKVSTGRKGYATPTGDYVITNKYRHWTSTLYDAAMPYFQRFSCGDFGMHAGYVPGYPASHGCIRVPPHMATKLFQLTTLGDRVVIQD